MSDIKKAGFKASEPFAALATYFDSLSDSERAAQIKKTNGIFEFAISNENKEEAFWTIDLKKEGKVYAGKAQSKPDVTILLADETFLDLSNGTTNGQKAFMTGKLKTKGNMMLAMKLDPILKAAKGAKL